MDCNYLKEFKMVFIALGSAISAFLGVLALPVYLLVACNIIDWITGMMAAKSRGQRLSSQVAMLGVFRKVAQWLLVVTGIIIDELLLYVAGNLPMELHIRFVVACVLTVWIMCNELLSILENIVDIGVKVPKFLIPLVEQIRDKTEDLIDVDDDEPEEVEDGNQEADI